MFINSISINNWKCIFKVQKRLADLNQRTSLFKDRLTLNSLYNYKITIKYKASWEPLILINLLFPDFGSQNALHEDVVLFIVSRLVIV